MSTSEIKRFATEHDPTEVWETVEADSAAILQGVLPNAQAQGFKQDMSPYVTDAWKDAEENGWKFNPQTIFTNGLLSKSGTYRHDILNNTTLNGLCKAAFKETGDYWVVSSVLRCTRPEHPSQPWHRDANGWPMLRFQMPDSPTMIVTLIIAITDCNVANGATSVFLGSHKWPSSDVPEGARSVRAELKAGDMLIMRAGTVHRGEEHTAEAPDDRQLIVLTVATCQLTQYESALALPRALIESLTPTAQQLVGWRGVYPAGSPSGLNTFGSKPVEKVLNLQSARFHEA